MELCEGRPGRNGSKGGQPPSFAAGSPRSMSSFTVPPWLLPQVLAMAKWCLLKTPGSGTPAKHAL